MAYLGFAIILLLIVGLAVYSGALGTGQKKQGLSAPVMVGLLMGTFVGGSSTVGTAQLAYTYGLSAWWFTLGGGISCLLLALVYIKPLRGENCPTLMGMLEREYGPSVGLATSLLNSVGTFINILTQLFSSAAVLLVLCPVLPNWLTIFLAMAMMILYVIFGGAKGAGMVGILKVVLIYAAMLLCGLLAWKFFGGAEGFAQALTAFRQETGMDFLSPFNRGFGVDAGACLSLLFGVISTQTYVQSILACRSDREAKKGALVAAFLIPLVGIFGILVGLYMRTVTDPALFNAQTALTSFILDYANLSPLLAGFILGVLFIAFVGTGAGLSLGIATVIDRDILQRTGHFRNISPQKLENILIVLVLLAAALVTFTPVSDTILKFAFLSMALRCCTVFAPLFFLLWAKGRVSPKAALAAVVLGSLFTLVLGVLDLFGLVQLFCDPVLPGVALEFLILLLALRK